MRVTNKMLSNNYLNDMSTNMENMKTLQQQLTSGKEIRKPSDDPFKVARTMQLHSDIDANKQYNKNILNTINWLDSTDTSLSQVGDVLQKVREKLIYAGNATCGPDERAAIKHEVNQRLGEISQILNSTFDGKYLFGGTRGTDKPTTVTTDVTSGNSTISLDATGVGLNQIKADLNVEISQGVTMKYNVSATDVMNYKEGTSKPGAPTNVQDLFTSIINHLDAKNADGTASTPDDVKQLVNDDLQGITDVMNNLLKVRAQVGAKQNRMDSAKDENVQQNFSMTDILSHTEDIDFAEKIMDYSTMMTVYMASLQTSAKILQPSLLDYMR